MSEEESYSITISGIDKVQNEMGVNEPKTFFGEMVATRPKLAEKLGVWFDFIHEKTGEVPNIRKVTFDLLEHVLDEFVESDTSVETVTTEDE